LDIQNPTTQHVINPWAGQDAIHSKQLEIWYAAAHWNEVLATPKPVVVQPKQRKVQPTVSVQGSGKCGGDLPPCSVMMCESGGSLTVQNPHSTASGKWQILDSTWNNYGGYSRAKDAPEAVQDARARQIYSGGAGRGAWVC
jgi:hypothetical protein